MLESNFIDLKSHLCSSLSEDDMDIFASIVYQLWRRRNQFVFEGKFEAPEREVQHATQLALDFKEANNKQISEVRTERPVIQ